MVKTHKPPNVLVFFSDQQRFDSLGCNGQPLDITPRIDHMAAEGVNYTMAYTPQPVCGPARAVMQSGLYATQTGCYRNGIPLPYDCDSLARRMKRAGYHVAYVGKWHLGSVGDAMEVMTAPVPLKSRGGYDEYWVAVESLPKTSRGYGGYIFDTEGGKRVFTGYRTDCVTDYALEYLDACPAGDGKPFFLFLSHIEPHHQPNTGLHEGPAGSREKYAGFIRPPDLAHGEGDWESQYPDYLGCCNALDRNLGRVLDKLGERGLSEETIVFYTSDHGSHFRTKTHEASPDGYDDYKRNCYENTIRVPLVVRGPGFTGGKIDSRLVSLLDIPKTIVDAAGGDNGGMAGESLFGQTGRDAVYIQISESFVGRAVRTGRYTYCVHAPGKHPWNDSASEIYRDRRLFDNDTDPCQETNLIYDPAYTEIKADLRAKLISLARQAGEGTITVTDDT